MEGEASVSDNTCTLSQQPNSPRSSTLNSPSIPSLSSCNRKKLKSVHFSKAHVFHFVRQQGNSSVPERGGCSLGMASTHFHSVSYGAVQYRRIRRIEKRLLTSNGILANGDGSSTQGSGRCRRRRFNGCRLSLIKSQISVNPGDSRRVPILYSPPNLTPQSYEYINPEFRLPMATPPPPCLSPPKEHFSTPTSMFNMCVDYVDIIDTDSEASMDSTSFKLQNPSKSVKLKNKLLPLPPNVRSRLLKQSGLKVIDESERWNCAKLRADRSRVGCNCFTSPCNPESCSCALDGVPCQVDRPGFPCSCCLVRCFNPNGRVEFSKPRVRAHAAHVFNRLAADSGNDHNLSPVNAGLHCGFSELSTAQGECMYCVRDAADSRQSSAHSFHALSPQLSHPISIPSQSNSPFRTPISPKQSPHRQGVYPPSPVSFISESSTTIITDPTAFTLTSDSSLNPPRYSLTQVADSSSSSAFIPPSSIPSDELCLSQQPIIRSPTSIVQKSELSRDYPFTTVEGGTTATSDLTPLSRLSLRKRRIIRSPLPGPYRKRIPKKLLHRSHLDSVQELSPLTSQPIPPTPSKIPLPPPSFTCISPRSPITRQVVLANPLNPHSPPSPRLQLNSLV